MPDCGPGSWIDFVAEDWRLLDAGKRRLLFDHTCGTVPLCTEPPSTPALPHSPHSPHTPPPTPPTPPPCAKPSFEHAHAPTPPKTHPPPHLQIVDGRFPPGTVNLPPAAPRVGLPPTSTVELGSTSVALLALAGAALLAFGGLQFYFMSLFRASAAAMRKKKNNNLIAVAQIDNTTGRARVITGVAVGGSGRRGNYIAERQSLLTGQKL